MLREEAAADEAEALRDDVALLRTEVIRLSDEVKRLQSAPRVSPLCPFRLRRATNFAMARALDLESAIAMQTGLCMAIPKPQAPELLTYFHF